MTNHFFICAHYVILWLIVLIEWDFLIWMFSSVLFGSGFLFLFSDNTLLIFIANSVRNCSRAASFDRVRWEPFACELVRWLFFMSDRWVTIPSGYSDKSLVRTVSSWASPEDIFRCLVLYFHVHSMLIIHVDLIVLAEYYILTLAFHLVFR